MSGPLQMRVCGFFRPRLESPGFAVPVFGDGKIGYFVQRVENERIVEFVSCDIETSELIPVERYREGTNAAHNSNANASRVATRNIGDRRFYAFQMPDGTIELGERNTIGSKIRRKISVLQKQPFLLTEIAKFLRDPKLKRAARQLTSPLLSGARKQRIIDPLNGIVAPAVERGFGPGTHERDNTTDTASVLAAKNDILDQGRNAVHHGKNAVELIKLRAESEEKVYKLTGEFVSKTERLVAGFELIGAKLAVLSQLTDALSVLRLIVDRGVNAIADRNEIAALVDAATNAIRRLLRSLKVE